PRLAAGGPARARRAPGRPRGHPPLPLVAAAGGAARLDREARAAPVGEPDARGRPGAAQQIALDHAPAAGRRSARRHAEAYLALDGHRGRTSCRRRLPSAPVSDASPSPASPRPTSPRPTRRICFYHAGCPDGFGAAWAVWKAWGAEGEYRPRGHDDALRPDELADALVVFADNAPSPASLRQLAERAGRVVVLDHHVS